MNLIPGVDTSEEILVLEQLAYQSTLYLPLTDSAVNIQDNDTLRDIVLKTVSAIDRGEIKRSDIAEYQKYIKELVDIIEAHPKIGAAQIGQMSWKVIDEATGKPFKKNGMVACTFINEETGQSSVCFRGTPSGSWIDNAKGITGILRARYLEDYNIPGGPTLRLSPMQCAALRYMGQLAGDGWVLSGHSKGGNETQLVAMVFADRIRAAYSFDGQSFPKETLNDLYKIESNNDALDMLLGINSDNDYVNGLAPRLTLANKTLFLQTAELGSGDILTNHYILSMLDNGNIADRGVPGPVSKTISRLSKDLLDIEDPNLREGAAFTVMSLLQAFLARKPPEDGLFGVGHAGLNIIGAIPSLVSLKLTGKLDLNASVLDYLNQDHLIDYLLIGEPNPDAAETFLGDHDFENQEDIENYLSEHTENSKLEYLVRGALLRCRYGSHARRLNLPKCHGVYITTHPVIHEANCVTGSGPQLDNIPFFGVCKAPIPPVVEEVAYTKDRPRDQYGCPCGEAPAGIEKGWKCQPEIIRLWRDTYPKTRIVDNGMIDSTDRQYANQEDRLPVGRSSVTTLSFLVCRYGGLIEPYNSGQEYISDEEEMAYAEENEIPTVVEEGGMAVVGGEDDPGLGTPISYESRTINGKMLSEEVGYMIDSMVQYDIDGETIHYDWHNIGQYLSENPSNMTPEKYDALCYVFGTMKSSDNIQKFINMGYWSADISQIEKPKPNAGSVLTPMDSYDYFNRSSQQQAIGSDYVYSAPNDILSGVMQWYRTAKEQGTLEDQYTLHSDILKSLSENGVGIFAPRNCSDEPITIDRHGFDYIVRIPPKEPYKADKQIEIEGNIMPPTDINPHG